MRAFRFYLVCTPIGNLGDLAFRAVEILKSVDLILAEDTRKARTLLSRHHLSTPVRLYHDHNKERITPQVLAEITGGKTVALITDAGTPTISDPGYYLIRRLIAEGIEYTVIPGPSAVTTALVLSGFPPDRFTFYGYFPRKPGARERVIAEAGAGTGTAIFFESPHRLLKTLNAIDRLLPGREVAVAREMTKIHEEMRRGSARELVDYYQGKKVKGEITVLIRGRGRGSVMEQLDRDTPSFHNIPG
ncbi:MAG: 16S rRNA (cytidine(1402)-2'-O)-methyltransferase [Candidatus Krumholzibacteriota bacterium]|nr:16S rRNA (cytidine(1402)-2'-O)-methyltransferase [Candidatus Krumholzibacteriota bacterium]